MNSLFTYLSESSICLLAFYLVYHFGLRKEKSFTTNRLYLLFAILASFLFPLLSIPLWKSSTGMNWQNDIIFYYGIKGTNNVTTQSESTFVLSWWMAIVIIYLLGIGFHISFRLRSWLKFQKSLKACIVGLDIIDGQKVFMVRGEMPHFSFLSRIYINTELLKNEKEFDQVLEHEKAHIQQWHSLDNLLIGIGKTIFWFHPMVYLLEKEIKKLHEYLADDHVVKKYEQEEYSILLARQAIQSIGFTGLHYFNKSLTLNRINMMKAIKHPASVRAYMLALATFATLFLFIACDKDEDLSPAEKSIEAYDQANKTQQELMEEFEALIKQIGGISEMSINKDAGTYTITLKSNNREITLDGKQNDITLDRMHELFSQIEREKVNKSQLADADDVFMVVENQPEPKRGMEHFYQYVARNLTYPAEARRLGIEGKVFVQFIVNEDGAISDVVAIRGIGGGCEEEAVRVISESENWKPGKQRGKFVKVRMVIPITFKLNDGNPVSMKIGN